MNTHRFGKKIKLPSTIAIKHQIRKLMWEDFRRSLSEETLREREIKAVSAPSTDHQSLISPPPAGAPNTLAATSIAMPRFERCCAGGETFPTRLSSLWSRSLDAR